MTPKQGTSDVQSFNRRSTNYEDSARQWFFFDRVQKTVLDLIKREGNPENILDVGCGTGRLLRKAMERWPEACLIGVDPAEGMLEKARELLPEATFYVSMAESLPLPDASVDVVVSTASFHHWRDQQQGIREIARVLRPNGQVLIADIVMPRGLASIVRHFKRNNPSKTQLMFTQAGLVVQEQQRRMARLLVVTIGTKKAA